MSEANTYNMPVDLILSQEPQLGQCVSTWVPIKITYCTNCKQPYAYQIHVFKQPGTNHYLEDAKFIYHNECPYCKVGKQRTELCAKHELLLCKLYENNKVVGENVPLCFVLIRKTRLFAQISKTYTPPA